MRIITFLAYSALIGLGILYVLWLASLPILVSFGIAVLAMNLTWGIPFVREILIERKDNIAREAEVRHLERLYRL